MHAKPDRRFRYTLRTLFVLLTALLVWLGFVTDRAVRQRRAIETVRKYGGEVFYHHQDVSRGRDPVGEPSLPRWLLDFVGEDYFVSVSEVRLPGWSKPEGQPCHVSDATLRMIGELPKLQLLDLEATPITDAGLGSLSSLPLVTLNLEGTRVTESAVDPIRKARGIPIYTDAQPDTDRD